MIDSSELTQLYGKLFTENLFNSIFLIISGIFLIIAWMIRNWFRNLMLEMKNNDYRGAVSKDNIIYSQLGEIREHYKASRAWIARLHNGVSFANGDSFKKYSLTHIVVQEGIAWPKDYPKSFQDVPVSFAYELLSILFKNKSIMIKTKAFSDNGYFKNKLTSDSVTDLYACLIEQNGNPIGFIGLTWTKHNKPPIGFDNTKVTDFVKSLSLLLSKKEKKLPFF